MRVWCITMIWDIQSCVQPVCSIEPHMRVCCITMKWDIQSCGQPVCSIAPCMRVQCITVRWDSHECTSAYSYRYRSIINAQTITSTVQSICLRYVCSFILHTLGCKECKMNEIIEHFKMQQMRYTSSSGLRSEVVYTTYTWRREGRDQSTFWL